MIEIAVAVIVAFVIGALLRRAFGGWLGMSRVALLSIMGSIAAGVAGWKYGLSWEPLAIAACWSWLWADGHEFDPPSKSLFYRYLAPMAVCAAIVGLPSLVLIGQAIFACYWLSWRLWPPYRAGGFIDGVYAYAELGAGGFAFAILTASMLM